MGFIDSIKPKAIEIFYKTGILPSLSISQAVLESGDGKSGLTKNANNLFGYKGKGTAGSVTMATSEYDAKTGTWRVEDAAFRAYNSIDESFDDYARLISTSSFYTKAAAAKDWKTAIFEIDASPYATDPNYAAKLAKIINDNKLYNIDAEVLNQKVTPDGGSSWGGTTGGSGSWSVPSNGGSSRSWGTNEGGEGLSGFFNINADGTLETVGEWFKSSVFVILGVLFVGAGIWFLFGTGGAVVNIASDVLKESVDNG